MVGETTLGLPDVGRVPDGAFLLDGRPEIVGAWDGEFVDGCAVGL